MAAARPVKDKQKETSERHQAVLSELLKDDDNKYCVDCDAKGPRWASWNLGVFLCIRCAGIHRNLGVHISRVKSVNLDSWTSEQISTMEDMGNSKARAVYEANLPDGYKRPQTDSALEQFIRAKYEQKKWIAKEWNPQQKQQQPRQQSRAGDSELATVESKRREPKSAASSAAPVAATPPAAVGSALKATASSSSLTAAGASPQQVSAPVATAAAVTKSSSQGIIGQQPQKATTNVDLLGGIDSSSQRQASSDRSVAASSVDLLADIFGGPAAESTATSGFGSTSGVVAKDDLFLAAEDKSKSQKDSIMALYGATSTGMGAPSAVYGTGAYNTAMPGLNAGAYGMPGGYAPLPGTVPAGTVVPQPGMPMMVGAPQPIAGAVIYPGMMVAPIVQQTPVMVNGFAPGYYTQQQHAYLASQQLPQQIATMSLGGQGSYAAQAQPQLPRQAQQAQVANGGIPGWTDGGSAATAKTLDFNLWH